MTNTEETGASVNEAQIAVHWREEEYFYPSAQFVEQANASGPGYTSGSRRNTSPSVSVSMRTCSIGTSTGRPRSIRATRRSGSGSSVGVSTQAITALTGTCPQRPTKRPLSGSQNRSPKKQRR